MNITEECIDKAVLNASKNNITDIVNQFADAMEQLPEQKNTPLAYATIAAHIAQMSVMTAVKEVLYELFTEKEE